MYVITAKTLKCIGVIAMASAFSTQSWSSPLCRFEPNGGEVVQGGSQVTIAWCASSFEQGVHIDLWDGETSMWMVVATGVTSKVGVFNWLVPIGLDGELFRIRVSSAVDQSVTEMSKTYFSIVSSNNSSNEHGTLSEVGDCVEIESSFEDVLYVRILKSVGSGVRVYDASGKQVVSVETDVLEKGALVEVDLRRLSRGYYVIQTGDIASGGCSLSVVL